MFSTDLELEGKPLYTMSTGWRLTEDVLVKTPFGSYLVKKVRYQKPDRRWDDEGKAVVIPA